MLINEQTPTREIVFFVMQSGQYFGNRSLSQVTGRGVGAVNGVLNEWRHIPPKGFTLERKNVPNSLGVMSALRYRLIKL